MQAARTLTRHTMIRPAPPAQTSAASVVSLESARQRRLIARYTELVERHVRRMMAKVGFCCEEDEIRSAAYLGLLEAARRFDATRGIPFEAFASHRIHGAIMDELRARDSLRRLSRQRARQISEARERLVRTLHREPTEQELARGTGEDLETFRHRSARERAQAMISLESLAANGWEDFVGSVDASALESLCERDLRRDLARALDDLPSRMRLILSRYYEDEKSYREIGEELGVTESRICQIVKGAQRSLRERLAAHAA